MASIKNQHPAKSLFESASEYRVFEKNGEISLCKPRDERTMQTTRVNYFVQNVLVAPLNLLNSLNIIPDYFQKKIAVVYY